MLSFAYFIYLCILREFSAFLQFLNFSMDIHRDPQSNNNKHLRVFNNSFSHEIKENCINCSYYPIILFAGNLSMSQQTIASQSFK